MHDFHNLSQLWSTVLFITPHKVLLAAAGHSTPNDPFFIFNKRQKCWDIRHFFENLRQIWPFTFDITPTPEAIYYLQDLPRLRCTTLTSRGGGVVVYKLQRKWSGKMVMLNLDYSPNNCLIDFWRSLLLHLMCWTDGGTWLSLESYTYIILWIRCSSKGIHL